ncbi:MAG TPA: ROK family protein [Thermoanaerobaculia bacterium]|nr:ROK family protein [Thermoanaerobaculia bacterium]
MAKPGGKGLALGIDLGGTKVLAGVVDPSNRILGRGKLRTPFADGPQAIGAAIVEACDLALKEAGAARSDVSSFAVAAPGAVDATKGTLLKAANLNASNWNVVKAVGTAFESAAGRLENDVRLAALAEARLGAGRGSSLMVALWVGTGVGGAVILNGKIHTGHNRNAGEIGHTQIDLRRARPGKVDGTLEGIAAKVGIAAYLRKRIDRGDRSELEKAVSKKDVRLKGSDLREAWEEGDELARRAISRSARAVGISIANVFNILSPDVFVLGGGVATDVGKPYLAEVRHWADAFSYTQDLGRIRVEPAGLGDDAGVLGAALYARD